MKILHEETVYQFIRFNICLYLISFFLSCPDTFSSTSFSHSPKSIIMSSQR